MVGAEHSTWLLPHVLRLLLLTFLSGVHAVDRAHAARVADKDHQPEAQALGGPGVFFFGKSGAHQPQALFSGSGGSGGGRPARLKDEHLRHAPPPSDCSKCDAIYAEWSELYGQQSRLIGRDGYISQILTNELLMFCEQAGNSYCQYLGCYISKGNATTVDPDRSPADTMCDRVPFRELAHTITAYALNGSDMLLWGVYREQYKVKFVVPNPWFVQTAFELNRVINSLPSGVRQAVKLAEEDAEPFLSIGEVFDAKIRNATFAYIRATSASWPWTPPLPPPPPTPPPCPGGDLQACMGMCPKESITEYKKCVQNCLDVCHGV